MAFCFRCQRFTENHSEEICLTKNGRERESSLCVLCNCKKSHFLGRKERQRIFGRQQYQDLYNHDVDSAFKEYTVMRSTWNDIAREENDGKIRLSNAIEHQWRIDHIPGYYRITQDEKSRMKGIKTTMKEKTKKQ